jgi:hypothetical protein
VIRGIEKRFDCLYAYIILSGGYTSWDWPIKVLDCAPRFLGQKTGACGYCEVHL